MDYQKLKKEFNALPPIQQWGWALKKQVEITLRLDNDTTSFTFNDEDDKEDVTIFYFKSDIGNRSGLDELLPLIGFRHEH